MVCVFFFLFIYWTEMSRVFSTLPNVLLDASYGL